MHCRLFAEFRGDGGGSEQGGKADEAPPRPGRTGARTPAGGRGPAAHAPARHPPRRLLDPEPVWRGGPQTQASQRPRTRFNNRDSGDMDKRRVLVTRTQTGLKG